MVMRNVKTNANSITANVIDTQVRFSSEGRRARLCSYNFAKWRLLNKLRMMLSVALNMEPSKCLGLSSDFLRIFVGTDCVKMKQIRHEDLEFCGNI